MSPGQWLRERRAAAGLSQTEAADRSRTTQATWSAFERDLFTDDIRVSVELMALAVGEPAYALRERLSTWTIPMKEAA